MESIHAIISGRVQGVAFRYYTRKKAYELGIKGTVENLEDGRVQIFALGAPQSIKEFITWCYKGPPASRVDNVKLHHSPDVSNWTDFRILR